MKSRYFPRSLRLACGALLIASFQVGCLGGGGGGGNPSGTPKEGELCVPPDNETGKSCVGTVRYDCEEDENTRNEGTESESRWHQEKDCADDGKICQDGACVDASEAGPECLDVSGSWRFTAHCDPAQVGRTFIVVQTACELVSNDGGFDGKVKASGDLKIEGVQNGQPYDCEGTVGAASFLLNCTGNCEVSGSRN